MRASVIAGSTAALVALSAAAGLIASLGPAPRGEGLAFSTLVVDRDGRLLRPYATPEGRWRLPAASTNQNEGAQENICGLWRASLASLGAIRQRRRITFAMANRKAWPSRSSMNSHKAGPNF